LIEAQDDFFDPAVHKWVADGGDFEVGGESFVKSKPVMAERSGARVYTKHFALAGGRWVKLAVVVRAKDPVADCYATQGYGNTGSSQPSYQRSGTIIRETTKAYAFKLDTKVGRVLHGQGATSAHWSFDFRKPRMLPTASVFTSRYVPHDGNQTGGQWEYMQYETPVKSKTLQEWRVALYPHARYGGRFVHLNGDPVTEADYPDAVLQNGSHFHRDTKTWINYTYPKEPWRDRADMRTADDQHFSVYDALCEVYTQYPHDEALRWEVIFAAERFLFQIPGRDKGTYQWDPGQERAQGRIPKFAAKCVRALKAAGRDDLAEKVGIRSAERLNNQVREFGENVRKGKTPFAYFEGRGKHSPAEIGIHWWGLDWAETMFRENGIEFLAAELAYMKNAMARFCFDSFFDFGDSLSLPYYVRTDWTHPRSPSGGTHLAWLAARHAIPLDQAEETKMGKLIDIGERLEDRWKGPLA
jgi:hypothetical protein